MDHTNIVTPEKVKDLLSSFLAKSNNSAEKNISTDGAGSNSDSGKDSEVPKASTSSVVLRSHASFLERLDSFSSLTWFARPVDLSPLICARYGWENVDADMLQCVCCKAFLSGQLPSKTDFQAYEVSCNKLKENLLSAHDKFCVLAANPCPEHFCHVPLDDPAYLITDFNNRVTELTHMKDRLPSIDNKNLSSLGYDEGQGGAYCKRHLLPDADVSPQLVTLAFTGWTCSPSNKDVLMCSMCRRQIGLWNYISSASRNRLSTESDEDECEEGEPTTKKKRVSVGIKQSLDPLSEHHHWCPWVQHIPLSVLPLSSASAEKQNTQAQGLRTLPACLLALRVIAPGLMDNNTGLATAMKTSPMIEGLRCFRRVINTWSSPKVNSSSSFS
ncbi:zinc finger C3HC-type protein 1-like [Physella acuta]|uniref:zinc finger C3HC-type protein 1-like n=1 Tax=Physella acuta TaxID=109671 RepID=UPI0027DBAE4E|nr:zinc finger C3HC-type protein 1-like [Physella acuta]